MVRTMNTDPVMDRVSLKAWDLIELMYDVDSQLETTDRTSISDNNIAGQAVLCGNLSRTVKIANPRT